MIKIGFALVVCATIASAFFPKTGLGHADSNNIDKSFIRDDAKEVVIDTKRSKMYYDSKPSAKMTFAQSQQFCKKMNFLNFHDWRVPSKNELRSLLELSRRSVTVKHAFKNIREDLYWSSTEARRNSAWYFDFDLGRYGARDESKKFRSICVRNFKK